MPNPVVRARTFLAELKRRKVYRVAVVYLVVAVASLELLDVVVPASTLPDWSDEFFLSLAVLGFPLALVLAWAFEITPDGMRRTVGWGGDADVRPEARPANAPHEVGAEASGEGVGQPELDAMTVAVLPFTNLSGTEEAEPFAAGLHDDLLTELSGLPSLTIISRTSVGGYRVGGKAVPQIAKELGAGTVVEGGVQMSGGRVRLNVQLIDARKDVHRWAERYDRELTASNIFEIQTELSRRIASTVNAALGGIAPTQSGEPATQDLEAYRLFAQGRDLFGHRTKEGMEQAVGCFERALARDPGYAPAWAGLANALILLVDYRHVPPDPALSRGEEAAGRALELDPDLAEAHAALGNLHSHLRQGPAAVRHHQRAIALQPSFAAPHLWLCWTHLLLGNPESALEAGMRAVRLDPLDAEGRTNLAIAHLGCGDAEAALTEARRAQERNAEFDYARFAVGLSLLALGEQHAALSVLEGLSEQWAREWARAARVLGHDGPGTETPGSAAEPTPLAPFHAGLVCAHAGDADGAFASFSRVTTWEWDEVLALRYLSGPLTALREDSRYAAVLGVVDRSFGLEGQS